MAIGQRIRGLLGTTVTWSAVGACFGAVGFLVRFRPWPLTVVRWERLLVNLAAFMGVGALWGAVCGLAFGLAVWHLGRRWSLQSVSATRVTVWGAIAGAAFPVLLYTPVVVFRGAYGLIPFYGMLAGLSALVGAGCARAVFAVARRAPAAPAAPSEPASLAAGAMGVASDSAFAGREREHA
jgi:hypothetical protein